MADLSADERLLYSVHKSMDEEEVQKLPLPERYIVSKLHLLVMQTTSSLEAHLFGDAGGSIHDFLWDEFADWFIEVSKPRMRSSDEVVVKRTRGVLLYVWDTCLRLLHPFMPFLTEALWQSLPPQRSGLGERQETSLMVSYWPIRKGNNTPLFVDPSAVSTFHSFQKLVRSLRAARVHYHVAPSKKITVLLRINEEVLLRKEVEAEKEVFCLLARVDQPSLVFLSEKEVQEVDGKVTVHLVVDEGVEAFLPQSGLIDREKELSRLSRQLEKISKDIEVLEKRLNSNGFVSRAPVEVVQDVKNSLRDLGEQKKTVQMGIDMLL